MEITRLNYDILLYLTNYLTCKEFCKLTQCNQYLYQTQQIDLVWKKYCKQDFQMTYNDPNQTYHQLYIDCQKQHKRLPCSHLSANYLDTPPSNQHAWLHDNKCQKCLITGIENLFICLTCHEIVCDRHARHHARKRTLESHHAVFYKPNMSELFCQICVDWIGGIDTISAERYYSQMITNKWLDYLYENSRYMKELILDFKLLRQQERQIRWKDTPQYIMNNNLGFCFISSTWMAEWEMFIEGWMTEPPLHVPIDQTSLLSHVSRLVHNNPFYLSSTDTAMIISKDTWNYISKNYTVIGKQITEDDLKPEMLYQAISKRIEFWKKRASV